MPALTERSSALFRAIASADADGVVAALRGASEAERAPLGAVLVGLEAATHSFGHHVLDDDGSLRWVERTGPAEDPELELDAAQSRLLNLAIMGTATPEQMRRVSWSLSWVDDARAAAVLLDRNPPWLASWSQWLLTTETMQVDWPLVRDLVRAGAITRPAAYIPALLRMRWGWDDEPLLPGLLDEDPEFFVQDVWDLIAYRGDDASQRAAEVVGWSEAIAARVTDRERLLDAILDALPDQSAYRAAWYTKLWKTLEPTRAESAARADALRRLLGEAAEPIVAFALDTLVRAGVPLAGADLAPALAASSKGIVRKALKQLDGEPAVAAIALAHPDPAIQGEVLGRLERWDLDDAARDALLRHLDVLAATQRPRAEALLNLKRDSPPLGSTIVDVDGVPEAIRSALNFGGPVPVAPVAGEPVLGEALEPIASIAELVAVLRTFEERDRVLDGLLRFCDQPAPPTLADGWFGFEAQAWIERAAAPVTEYSTRTAPSAAELRIARGTRGRYLPLPTHTGGWIDPRVLVERLREPASDEDFTAALFRLAPDHRAEALEAARELPGRHGERLRCALGGEPVDDFAARAVRLPPLVELEVGVGAEFRARVTPGLPEGIDAFPSRRDVACAHAFRAAAWHLEDYPTHDRTVAQLLELLGAPTEPLAPLTLRLLVVALGSLDDRERLLAVDVLIAAIEDGRVDALPTDDVPHIKPNRLATRLQAVAAASPWHAAVVREFLDASIHLAAARPGPLLVLFDELSAQTATGPRASREHLATVKHKSARALLGRTGEPRPDEALLALAARARRAYRWMSS